MDRGVYSPAIVHRFTKCWTCLSDLAPSTTHKNTNKGPVMIIINIFVTSQLDRNASSRTRCMTTSGSPPP